MPRLFLSAMIVAAWFSLPAIKNLNIPPDNLLKLNKDCIQTQQLNDTVFSLTGKILGLKKGIILIDPEGKIIGRYSEDEGPLDEMLKKIFGE